MTVVYKHKRKDGLKRQADIMAISLKIFAEKGYHATSIEEIINTAGIAKGTFYLHFKGKMDIFHRLIDFAMEKLFNSIKILDISSPIPINDVKKLYITFTKIITTNEEFNTLVKFLLRELREPDPSLHQKANLFYDNIITMSSNYIKKAQTDGRVNNKLDPKVISYCILGAVKELLYRWIILEEDLEIEKSITTTIDLFFDGMLSLNEKNKD